MPVRVPNSGVHGLYRGCKYTKRVMQLQRALNLALDTRLMIDGVYGKYTQMVVALFQWRVDIVPTSGRYDVATEQALRRFLGEPSGSVRIDIGADHRGSVTGSDESVG